METKTIQNAMSKMGQLLKIGFGEVSGCRGPSSTVCVAIVDYRFQRWDELARRPGTRSAQAFTISMWPRLMF